MCIGIAHILLRNKHRKNFYDTSGIMCSWKSAYGGPGNGVSVDRETGLVTVRAESRTPRCHSCICGRIFGVQSRTVKTDRKGYNHPPK